MWNETYSTDEFVYGTQPNDFLKDNAGKLKPGSVLCLADGEGRNGVYLAKLGFDVTSIDLSSVALEKSRRFAEESGVEVKTVHADLNDFVIEPNSWDNIVAVFINMLPELRGKVHAAVAQGLIEGGMVLLEAYTPRQLDMPGKGGPPVAEPMFSAEMLINDFKSLEVIQYLETDREIHEGTMHQGLSAVVQFIARK